MAREIWVSTAYIDAEANAIAKALDGGTMCIHDGPRSEATSNAPIVTLRLGSPAFGPSREGSIAATSITPAVARRDGTASWARLAGRDGKWMFDLTVGVRDVPAGARYGVELPNTKIVAGVEIMPVMYTHTVGRS